VMGVGLGLVANATCPQCSWAAGGDIGHPEVVSSGFVAQR
jgi:hypothetical protein